MPIYSAMTTTGGQAPAEALAEAVEEIEPAPYAVGAFEIEDGAGRWEVGAHFEEAPDEVALSILAAAYGAADFVVSEVPDEDWVAKVRRDLPPVEAGRFFVYGSHAADALPGDKIGLLIEASMAFGTGHHGTTLGCLRAFDRLLDAGFGPVPVADIGCGTAVLAMAAARVWPEARIVAGDNDSVAIEVAEANLAANGMAGRVACHVSEGFAAPEISGAGPFGLIFANILKNPLIALAPDIAAHCAPGGKVILSGLLVEQADEVIEVYRANGLNLDHRGEIGDWATLILNCKM